jgi:hypothetical protein
MIKQYVMEAAIRVEAIQLTKGTLDEITQWLETDKVFWYFNEEHRYLEIDTLIGAMKAYYGDYIVRHPGSSEFTVCEKRQFETSAAVLQGENE